MLSCCESYISRTVSIAPLITFRILFGALMMLGTIRFAYQGWIERLYLEPKLFFKFYGFEWVQMPGEMGMYLLFTVAAISAGMIMLGLFYRLATILFFLSFTYIELIDATNYLNHYYLVCLFAFLLIFLPAHRAYSLDTWRKPHLVQSHVPAWTINILIFQLTVVYTCAGIAKLNPDWLFKAMPLAIWLPEHTDIPILGYFFQFKWVAYLFSWGGAIYDLSIAYFLMHKRTRLFAYLLVILFHGMTYLLFNIGLFPFIMIFSTLIFFPASFHTNILRYTIPPSFHHTSQLTLRSSQNYLLIFFCLLQLLLPFRHLLYPGNVLWTEEGYRFAWRVMLVEKNGQAIFHIKDPTTGRSTDIINGQYLTKFQEKQMSIQPDFMLQFAHHLKKEYQMKHGIEQPIITVDAHISLNARPSKRLIDPNINLAAIHDSFKPKEWILKP